MARYIAKSRFFGARKEILICMAIKRGHSAEEKPR